MKPIFLLIFVLIFENLSAQQNNRCYSYDNAGNRITKNVCYYFRVMPDIAGTPETVPHNDADLRTSQDVGVNIVPNPSVGYFEIRTKGYSQKAQYCVLSPAGQKVVEGHFLPDAIIDLTHLPSGTYTIVLSEGQKSNSEKIIIIH
jgi:hypothetical protein